MKTLNNRFRLMASVCALLSAGISLHGQTPHRQTPQDMRSSSGIRPNPAHSRSPGGGGSPQSSNPSRAARFPEEYRSVDGYGNNRRHPEWGSANIAFLRLLPADYADGVGSPSGTQRPSARHISNAAADQTEDQPNSRRASDMLWQWGQFLDHDINLTPVGDPPEPFDIPVPTGDPWFDPTGSGTASIPLDRSYHEEPNGIRQQFNEITAYIDASNVYGSDEVRALALRTLDGSGRLLTSDGDLLPYNWAGLANAPSSSPVFYLAGDFRANEQVGLTTLHALFVREHNHWADRIRVRLPDLTGEEVYQMTRAIVAAEMQAITYNEFLPVLLGRDALSPYAGYQPSVNPGIANEFATAAYRVGHTMFSTQLLRLDAQGLPLVEGPLSLAGAFFNPSALVEHGLEPYLRGLAAQVCQEIDSQLVGDVRNFLFGPPGSGGFDLAALNIRRGRDHGLPDYNTMRQALGLQPATRFDQITRDPNTQARLEAAYGTSDDMDLWVAGLAGDHLPDAMVGPTFATILADQFQRLRDGDRFWYQAYLPEFLIQEVEASTLAEIIRRNTTIGSEIQDNVFVVPSRPPSDPRRGRESPSRRRR